MKRPGIWLLMLLVALGSGCGAKRKEITDLQRKEAAHLFSEAEFAMTLRDWPRAESLLNKVVELAPDTGSYWVSLGLARRRLENRSGAREAYQAALKAYEAEAKEHENDPEPWLQQVHLLALLGRIDDARKLIARMAERFPNDRNVRAFVETKQFDALLADAKFKEMAI